MEVRISMPEDFGELIKSLDGFNLSSNKWLLGDMV
jgi:hypothetical protein